MDGPFGMTPKRAFFISLVGHCLPFLAMLLFIGNSGIKGGYPSADTNILPKKSETTEVEAITEDGLQKLFNSKDDNKDCKKWYGGIGIVHNNFSLKITEIIEGYPASFSGLRIGDELVGNPDDIRGDPGTEVYVTVRRGTEILEFKLTRGKICLQDGDIGMKFKEEIDKYLNSDGFVLAENRDTKEKYIDGNITLYSAQRILFLKRQGILNVVEEFGKFQSIVAKTEIEDGLFQRAYKPADKQEHDDYVGLLFMGYYLDKRVCQRIVRYGRSNWFAWDNLHPGKFSLAKFFVRFPGFWSFAKIAKGEYVGPLGQLMSTIDLLFTVLRDDGSSGHNLDDLKIEVYKEKSWVLYPILRAGVALTEHIYNRKHPNGRSESYEEYFGPTHPYATYAQKEVK